VDTQTAHLAVSCSIDRLTVLEALGKQRGYIVRVTLEEVAWVELLVVIIVVEVAVRVNIGMSDIFWSTTVATRDEACMLSNRNFATLSSHSAYVH
jgi:hypothetical protein